MKNKDLALIFLTSIIGLVFVAFKVVTKILFEWYVIYAVAIFFALLAATKLFLLCLSQTFPNKEEVGTLGKEGQPTVVLGNPPEIYDYSYKSTVGLHDKTSLPCWKYGALTRRAISPGEGSPPGVKVSSSKVSVRPGRDV